MYRFHINNNMYMKKITCVILLYLISNGVSANNLQLNDENLIANPHCDIDEDVTFIKTTNEKLTNIAKARFAAAFKGFRTGKRIVAIDYKLLQTYPASVQYVIIQHECAHHKFNDMAHDPSLLFERRADCYAAIKAAEILNNKQIKQVYDFLKSETVNITTIEPQTMNHSSAYVRNWKHNERLRLTEHCVNIGLTAK